MKEAIQRFFAVVSYEQMRDNFANVASELEEQRNLIRKKALDEMDKLNARTDGEKIQELMMQMNRDLAMTYEKEMTLREFIDLCK